MSNDNGFSKNWATDLTDQEKNGTFIFNKEDGFEVRYDIQPNYEAINSEFELLE